MKYQLVLQWPSETTDADFETLCRTERLVRLLPFGNQVDGHDIGSGEANIFILTNDPLGCFEQVKAILESHPIWKGRVAYREESGENYVVVWPKGLRNFRVI
ncbi:MAG TPA: hypothetical protein VMB47_04295 [Candidatus Aquilonibacter sp.]|nr:hypothetical protein [Candidatus Aquilonibacter sp.]